MSAQETLAFARLHSGWFDFSRSDCPENLITNNVLVVTTFPTPVWEQEARRLREGPKTDTRVEVEGRG